MADKKKVVLITGASSGLGLAVANLLFEKGYTVYAGARSFKNTGQKELTREEGHLYRMYLDVTDQTSISELVNTVMQREGRLDVLINCAVHLVLGSVEDTSFDEFEGVVETSLLGTFRMCKKAVPIMREQKEGLIINFSSVCGIFGIPFSSAYCSSKFAIEGLSETLSMEVKDFGIKVVLIEPGDHRSGSQLYRPHAKKADSKESIYYERYRNATDVIERDESGGSRPEHLAALVEKIIENPKPKFRYRAVEQFSQKLAILCYRLLPGRVFEKMLSDYYYAGIKNKKS